MNRTISIVCAVWLVSGYLAVMVTVAGVSELAKRGRDE